jgi:hypothetical protein
MLRTASLVLTPVVLLAMALPGQSAEKKAKKSAKPATSAADAADFQVQGEYVGTTLEGGNEVKGGVQVTALGDGKFHAVTYLGGLPGDGWTKEDGVELDGQTKDGVTVLSTRGDTGTLKDGVITVKDSNGQVKGTLKKVTRQSPTLGVKPPEGAIVLFDGTSADEFQGGQIEDGWLKEGDTSKRKFQNFSIHLEFRTPFEPKKRGQGRGNSGFYAQGRYEVQILDSFGLKGEKNECGAIYGVSKPKLNMCYPPMSWQTYDMDFTAAEYKDGKKVKNARMTVKHNGVLVQDNVEVPHGTTAHPVPEGAEPGPVYLQNHGNPVRFRNIWVVPK